MATRPRNTIGPGPLDAYDVRTHEYIDRRAECVADGLNGLRMVLGLIANVDPAKEDGQSVVDLAEFVASALEGVDADVTELRQVLALAHIHWTPELAAEYPGAPCLPGWFRVGEEVHARRAAVQARRDTARAAGGAR